MPAAVTYVVSLAVQNLHFKPCVSRPCCPVLQVSDQDVEGIESGGEMLRQRRASGSKCSLLVGVGRQSSGVNLNRLGPESDLKRLVEEVGSFADKTQCLCLCCLCNCVSRSVCLCPADVHMSS